MNDHLDYGSGEHNFLLLVLVEIVGFINMDYSKKLYPMIIISCSIESY